MAEPTGLTKFLQDVFDKIEGVKNSVESSAPVRTIKLINSLSSPSVTPQQKVTNTMKLVAPVVAKTAPAVIKAATAPKVKLSSTIEKPNYTVNKVPGGTFITPKVGESPKISILPPGNAPLATPAAEGTLKKVPVVGEKLQQFAENDFVTKNKAPVWNIPVRGTQEAFDLLVNLGKGIIFGDVKETRDLLGIYNKMKEGLDVTDAEVEKISKANNRQMMDLAMAMSTNLENVNGKIKPQLPKKDVLKNVANDIKKTVEDVKQLRLFPEEQTKISGLLEAPEQVLALPGKFVAKTKSEAKKLFKLTGKSPELDFVLQGKNKAIPLTSKVEELITTNKKGVTIPVEWVNTIKNWKDKGFLGTARMNRETPARLAVEILGPEDGAKLNDFLFRKVGENEVARIKYVNALRKELGADLKKAGIRGGSADDALIFRFGEGKMTLDDLKKASPQKWQSISEIARKFRGYYDELLDMANSARAKYGHAPIPKRENYFTHIQEIRNVFDELGMLLKRPNELPTETAGLTQFFKPGQPFSSFALERKGDKAYESAVGAMDAYLDSMTRQIFHTDSVQRARAFEDFVRQRGENLPQLASWSRDYANSLAGKKTDVDRVLESQVGREVYKIANYISRRFGANAVAGNISSALTNFIPFTQAAAVTDKATLLRSMLRNFNAAALEVDDLARVGDEQSVFLAKRFPVERIDFTKKSEQAAEFLTRVFKGIDKYTSKSIVEAKYIEGLKQGMDSPAAIKYADDWAAKIIGDRTIGQTPQYFDSKAWKPITQFQLEVNNLWSFLLKDVPRDYAKGSALKTAYGLTMYSILAHIYNNAFESIAGRRPTFDPLEIGLNMTRDDKTGGQKLYAAAGDLVNNLPFTSFLTGGRIPYLPTSVVGDAKELITGTDPAVRTEAFTDMLRDLGFSLGTPFGGGQAKKILQGIAVQYQGGVFDDKGNLKYPVGNQLDDVLRNVLFGQYAGPEARLYFDEQLSTLSKEETAVWKRMTESGTDPVVAWASIYRAKAQKAYVNGLKEAIKSGRDVEGRKTILRNHYDFVINKLDELTDGETANTGYPGTDAGGMTPSPLITSNNKPRIKVKSGKVPGISTPTLKVKRISNSQPTMPENIVNLQPPKIEELLAKADKELKLS